VGKNCIVLGDWKLITSGTSPDFWQSPTFPNSTSAAAISQASEGGSTSAIVDALHASLEFNTGAEGLTDELEGILAKPSASTVCSNDKKWQNMCWNVQGGHTTDRLILYGRSGQANGIFSITGGASTHPPTLTPILTLSVKVVFTRPS
jgi:hypothetical protein